MWDGLWSALKFLYIVVGVGVCTYAMILMAALLYGGWRMRDWRD